MAIECNPAHLEFRHIELLKKFGFNRISVGIQDFRDDVLEAINRKPSKHPIDDIRVETVGPPFKGNEVKIASDGEILVKGENVMLGYWNLKDETEKVIKDGWLHTGDIGELDKNNYLKITDRKKDIIVNLGGDNISPSKVENILCLNEFIKQSFVYGDKKKLFSCINSL